MGSTLAAALGSLLLMPSSLLRKVSHLPMASPYLDGSLAAHSVRIFASETRGSRALGIGLDQLIDQVLGLIVLAPFGLDGRSQGLQGRLWPCLTCLVEILVVHSPCR